MSFFAGIGGWTKTKRKKTPQVDMAAVMSANVIAIALLLAM